MLIALAAAPPPVSQCQTLPSPTPSPSAAPSSSDSSSPSASSSPSSSAPAVQLCVSVQSEQGSFQAGQAALFIVQVWVQGGPVAGVIVSVASDPSGAYFSQFCPGGNGSASCTIGSMGTATNPSVFRMEAATNVLANGASQAKLSVTAVADSTPPMSVTPFVSQAVPVTGAPAKPSPKPSAKPSTSHPATTPASAPPAVVPVPPVGALPSLVPMPAPAGSQAESASPGSLANALPPVTPSAPATPQLASPPSSEGLSPAAALSTEGMSTAPDAAIGTRHATALEQTLAWVLVLFGLALMFFLGTTRYLSRRKRRKAKRARPKRPTAPVSVTKTAAIEPPVLAVAASPAMSSAISPAVPPMPPAVPPMANAADATVTAPLSSLALKAPVVDPVEDRWRSLPGEYLG